ncbi:hypothetical protein N0V90_004017 [Kalmusia sp. IMI 367209]|nr:hypothetical protein N0V90_004017 [Kalmusia sp. IMI 367209]
MRGRYIHGIPLTAAVTNFYQFNPPPHPHLHRSPQRIRAAQQRRKPVPTPPPPQSYTDPQQPSTQTYTQHLAQAPSHQPSIPPPDDGWLPDVLKDKSPETAHPSLPASTAPLQALLAQNVALAESLKQLEAHLQHQRESTQSRLLSLRALEGQWRAKQAEQDEVLREFSPPALYQRLSAAVGEQEALCRGLEESFLEGEGAGGSHALASEREVTDFVRRLREGRKVAYLRAERKERWDEGRVGGWR